MRVMPGLVFSTRLLKGRYRLRLPEFGRKVGMPVLKPRGWWRF